MAVAGIDIRAITQGMRDMRDRLLAEPAEENIALKYACLRNLMYDHGFRLEMMAFFEPRAGLLRQVVDPGLRRERGQGGQGACTLWCPSNSEGPPLHRPVHQQGSPILFETFIEGAGAGRQRG